MGGCGLFRPAVGVVCKLECAEGKLAGWKRGRPGNLRDPGPFAVVLDEFCLAPGLNLLCAAMLVVVVSTRGEPGCLKGR